MAAPRNQSDPPNDIFDTYGKAIRSQGSSIKDIQNNKRPTAPIYDNTNFPSNPVVGQYTVTLDNTFWFFGVDEAWHQICVCV